MKSKGKEVSPFRDEKRTLVFIWHRVARYWSWEGRTDARRARNWGRRPIADVGFMGTSHQLWGPVVLNTASDCQPLSDCRFW